MNYPYSAFQKIMGNKNIEEKVKEVILTENTEIDVEGYHYSIKPITAADFIRISALVSRLKEVDIDSVIVERGMGITHAFVVEHAGAIDILAKIAAIGIPEIIEKKVSLAKRVKALFKNKKKNNGISFKEILNRHTPYGVSIIATEVLKTTRIDFFLGTMVFLRGLNLLKETGTNRKEEETTASGQSLEGLRDVLD